MRRRKRMMEDLDQDIRDHIEMETQDNIERGMPPEEARYAALRKFGSVTRAKEQTREVWSFTWLEHLLQDVRFGARTLRKNRGFTILAVFTVALGIGANTAMFSVMENVVLAPLRFFQPDRLVAVWESNPRFPRVWISYPNFLDRQRIARSFEQMAAMTWQGYDLTSLGTPEHIDGEEISSSFFNTLGVKLALGREFSLNEDQHGGAPVAIISNRLWRAKFYSNPQALGKSVTLDGVDYTIVGVTSPAFHFEGDPDVYTPLGQGDPLVLSVRGSHSIFSIARLKPGVSLSQAQAEMSTIQTRLDRLYPDANRDLGVNIEPLKQEIVGDIGGTLMLLSGAVGVVLLIACANVANLLLARSAVRTREFAIRFALGANRARVVGQLLTESVLLSLIGAGLGLLVAMLGVRFVLAAVPKILPRSENISVNAPVLFFTLGVSIAVGILFGLAPALQSWNADLQASLKEGGRGSTGSHHRAQSSLVIVQIALTLVLLVGVGLLLRTIRQLWSVNPGFDTQHVISFKVGVSSSLTKTAANTRIAYQQLIERIRKIPGVQAADFTDTVPLGGQGGTEPFWIGSQKPASLQGAPRLVMSLTGPDYLRTMGIPLLRGRFFTLEDTTKSPCVMVIDSVFAHMYFPDVDPLDQTLSAGFAPVGPCRIIGIVGHVKQWALDDSSTYIQNQAYFSLYQDPDQWVAENFPYLTAMVRTSLEPMTVMPTIKAAVYGAGTDQPVYHVQTMQQFVSESMSSRRLPLILLGAFASIALLLASIGTYGVISYSVTQRVHEIGIRMALGAEKRQIFQMVIGQGLRLAVSGLIIGAIAALFLTRLLSSFSHLLYGVGASDPVTFAAVSLMLAGAAILGCYAPARRASRVDPMVALRDE
jgi:predicted permease